MRNRICILTQMLLLFAFGLNAQQQPGAPDPLADMLFAPDLVMSHQGEIALSEAQKTYLRAEVLKAQTRFTELQWQLQDNMEGLIGLLKQSKVDEGQVSTQLDKVLASEREIKKAQISLLVRIKNNLTPAQQLRLETLRGHAK